MTRYLTLSAAAYALLAVESALRTESELVTPYGSFVWLLLPWLAMLPSSGAGVLAAAVYGLMLDSLSGHHPGLMLAVTVLSTAVLQRTLPDSSLETAPRVFLVSFVCATLMAMLVATASLLVGSGSIDPVQLVTSIAVSSAAAAVTATVVVAAAHASRRLIQPLRLQGH